MFSIESLLRILKKENSFIEFEINTYNELSGVKWIEYRKGNKNSIVLPAGAEWTEENCLKYKGKKFMLIPMAEKVIG